MNYNLTFHQSPLLWFRERNSNPRLLTVLCVQSYNILSSGLPPMTSLWKHCLFSQKQLCFHGEASKTRKEHQWPQRWQKAPEKRSLEKAGSGRKHGWLELRSRRPIPGLGSGGEDYLRSLLDCQSFHWPRVAS